MKHELFQDFHLFFYALFLCFMLSQRVCTVIHFTFYSCYWETKTFRMPKQPEITEFYKTSMNVNVKKYL